MANEAESGLPLYVKGKVVKGFGRGSKQLGFPTANFEEDVVAKMPATMDNGVYFGWANINKGPVYKMILSIGWNPYYKNEKKTMILNFVPLVFKVAELGLNSTLAPFSVAACTEKMLLLNEEKLVIMANEAECGLPLYVKGKVVKGFGRGSKQLGFPTANFEEDVVAKMPATMDNGVYFGWANINKGPVYKMILSIGWNPYYKNEKKTMETHILNAYKEDFYGSQLKVVIVGYLRPMLDFNNVEELIEAIKSDLEKASSLLEKTEAAVFKDDNFFKTDLEC